MQRAERAIDPLYPLATARDTDAPQAAPLWRMLRQTFGVDLKWWVPCWGGGMVLTHFLRIGYVPSLSLGDLGVVLSAVALFGGLALLGFLALLVVPAWMIGLMVDQHLLPVPLRAKQNVTPRSALRSYYRHAQLKPGKRRKRVLDRLPVFACAAVLAACYYAVMLLCAHGGHGRVATYGIVAGFCIGASGLTILAVAWDLDRVRRLWPLLRKRRGTLALMLLLYLAFWPLAGFAVGYLAPPTAGADWMYLILSAVMVIMMHWAIYATHRAGFSQRLRVVGPAMLVALLYSGGLLGMVDVSVRKLGIGMLDGVQLQLTEQGCQIVKASWPEAACRRAQPSSPVFVLPAVDIVTRLGSDFYVTQPGGLADESKPRLLIPASQILSWSRVGKSRKVAATAAPTR
ncbi:hypothetical protein [Xanthomonas melonis]|uniref:hypothetical protein n=1 Tax=Xanthomonas melonis TaxID=56456 RepID=UPI0011B02DFF|nr:hypothetical protein [Xanthomonas melonis]MCC4600592.1 hypothetical protein [Xanthomonas melonis]